MEDIEGIEVDILETSRSGDEMEDSRMEKVDLKNPNSKEEEDEEGENNVYKENFWPAKPDTPKGYTFKGKRKTKTFIMEKVKAELKKGLEKDVDDVKFKVFDKRQVGGATQVIIEINDKEGRGNAVTDFWGPNKRKECTILIKKLKDHEERFVTILAKSIIQPLLDCFISGHGYESLFGPSKNKTTGKTQKTKNECMICNKKLSSQKYLKIHLDRIYGSYKYKCNQCDFSAKEESQLNTHISNNHKEGGMDPVVKDETEPGEHLKQLEKMSFEEARLNDTMMDTAVVDKESNEYIKRSKLRDEQIIMKEK